MASFSALFPLLDSLSRLVFRAAGNPAFLPEVGLFLPYNYNWIRDASRIPRQKTAQGSVVRQPGPFAARALLINKAALMCMAILKEAGEESK